MIRIAMHSVRPAQPGRVRLAGVAACVPAYRRTSREVEELVAMNSPSITVPPGIVEATTGIRTRAVAEEGVNCSDLAAEAAEHVLRKTGTRRTEVDLLIFAAASQDLLEPATANIVQEKLGTSCPVFDLKNACNSFLNALEVGAALIQGGAYKRVLIAAGELPSRGIRWAVRDRAEFKHSFPAYTLGDAGAAVLLVPSDDERGIFFSAFRTASRFWDIGMLPGGGSIHPRGDEYSYFRMNGALLNEAFHAIGPGVVHEALEATRTTYADYDRILVHQISMPFLAKIVDACGIPREKVVVTLPELGNMVAASLPVAFALAEERGEIRPGDRVMWFGQAAGISVGVVLMRV
jgi:3-oxoacyl-[acyl-carrier-protein] synthase-3